ncbi:MAG: hypothetical protein CMB99_00770 [Flavobacteriaceae bacterium]|nr:hypothetical protein [Flavobacteriaceae bacterium]
MLNHDSSGFLVGERISLASEKSTLDAISNDVRAIRKAIMGASMTRRRSASTKSGNLRPVAVATPMKARRSGVQTVSASPSVAAFDAPVSVASKPVSKPVRNSDELTSAVVNGRDARGRFVGGGGSSSTADDPGESHKLSNALRYIGGAIEASAGVDAEGADPMVKAYGEIAAPIAGIAGGMRSLSGFAKGEERFYNKWFKKITGIMTLSRKEEAEETKDTQDLLEDLQGRNGKDGKNGKAGLLSSVASRMLGGAAGFLGKAGKGLLGGLKKLPVIGGLIGAGSFLMDAFSINSNDDLSRREKDQRIGGSGGGILGMLGGAAAGALMGSVVGPIGTIVGGVAGAFFGDKAGQVVGERVGLWVNDLRAADVPGKLLSVWNTMTAPLKTAATTITTWWSENMPSLGSVAEGVKGFVSDTFGIDFGKSTDAIKSTAMDALGDTILGRQAMRFLGIDSAASTASPKLSNSPMLKAPTAPRPPAMRAPVRPAEPPARQRVDSPAPMTIKAVMPAPDAGQDVRDRQISHITTGGMN